MALSNWDTLAVDEQGQSINGLFVSPSGIRVESYKNWLYVHDEQSWREGGRFMADTVAEIQQGVIDLHDVHIRAVRGPQKGIYFAVWSKDKGIVGCAVSGYRSGWREQLARAIEDFGFALYDWPLPVIIKRKHIPYRWLYRLLHDPDVPWVGVTPKAVKYLQRLLADTSDSSLFWDVPEALKRVNLKAALRFNQGDAYFADHLGFETPATAVGEAGPSILMKTLKEEEENG